MVRKVGAPRMLLMCDDSHLNILCGRMTGPFLKGELVDLVRKSFILVLDSFRLSAELRMSL